MTGSWRNRAQKLLGQTVDAVPQEVIDRGLKTLRRLPIRRGTNVYARDWDVLVILDACRYDMYQEIIGPSDALVSVGSTSTEWIRNTFTDAYAVGTADTAYVSANPYSHQLNQSRFGHIEPVWKHHWDEDLGTIPPGPVTDHGIDAARSGEYGRVILHYMQPHFPFIADGEPAFGRLGRGGFGLGDETSKNVWHMLADGELDADDVITAYFDNLRFVWESVETVLANVDGLVAITADHGNALGEWGMWGHRAYVPSTALKKVPWDVRKCTDTGEYEPDLTDPAERDQSEDVAEQLRALGYAE